MALDRLEPDLVEVVDRRAEPDRLRDRSGAGLELVRELVPRRPLDRDLADHVAAELEGRHRLEVLGAPPEDADSGRRAHLVAREGVEVGAERLHVDRAVRDGLRAVDDDDRALLVPPGDEPLDRD